MNASQTVDPNNSKRTVVVTNTIDRLNMMKEGKTPLCDVKG